MTYQRIATIASRRELAPGVVSLLVDCGDIAGTAEPGQFINVRVGEGSVPLLRRPFSISSVQDSRLEIVFNAVGRGTQMLSRALPGDRIDLLGPLGKPFRRGGTYSTAVIAAGGMGTAPFPFLTSRLLAEGKRVITFAGARTAPLLLPLELHDARFATDDGSKGFKGTVVELMERESLWSMPDDVTIFGCGPMPMLRAVAAFAAGRGIRCELSLEGDMACGIGLCQGCVVERAGGPKRYALMCVDGPAFNSRELRL